MRIFLAIIKTGIFSGLISIACMFILSLLFNDVIAIKFFEYIIGMFLTGFVLFLLTISVYLPIALISKNLPERKEERFIKYLPAVILPIMLIILFVISASAILFRENELLVFFINGILTTYASYFIFFGSLK